MFILKFWREIIDIIFPIECLGCGMEGNWLCKDCFKKIFLNIGPYCLNCKTETNYGEFCRRCRNGSSLDGVFIAGDYNQEVLQKLIKTLKYKFISDISGSLGELLFLYIREQIKKSRQNEWLNPAGVDGIRAPRILLDFHRTLVVPVPLHKKRKKWRGFNQSEEIGKVFADYCGLHLSHDDLRRIRHTRAQARLNEKDRQNNLQGSFKWVGAELSGRNVLVIDDVVTTGATLEECAQILKRAGAGEVWGLVVAKG